ncbi:MAG: hypothetical protein WCD21_29970, partial [Streptomyces sp.]
MPRLRTRDPVRIQDPPGSLGFGLTPPLLRAVPALPFPVVALVALAPVAPLGPRRVTALAESRALPVRPAGPGPRQLRAAPRCRIPAPLD